jgi:hypothetical protein
MLGNACKFTSNGTVSLTVSSIEVGKLGWVQFAVKDTGIGMSPVHTKRIFDAFAQADASTTRKFGGTGLGLAISKQFSKLLGGDITVQSELDKGSVFTLYLPRIVRQSTGYGQNLRNVDHRRSRSASVFVLESNDMLRDKLQVMLIEKGFEVNASAFNQAGVEASAMISPDVVIRNAMFEESVIRELYNHYCDYQYASIPVILESGDESGRNGGVLCYHEYFPNMPVISLINLYEHTQQRGVVLLREKAGLVTSLTMAHDLQEAMDLINKQMPHLFLLDPVCIAAGDSGQMALLFNAIYEHNTRLAIINPVDAGYKGFCATMQALSVITEKLNSTRINFSRLIMQSVINTVRKDTMANLADIRVTYNQMSENRGIRINEKL